MLKMSEIQGENMDLKELMCVIVGAIGGYATSLLGGWDVALQTLIIFMIIDYMTGCVVAAVFKKSTKTESGKLSSRVGFKGLCRKGMVLSIVLVATQLDKVAGSEIVRNAVIIGYIANESISILENAGLMGLPIPDVLRQTIDLLTKKESDKID